ncbi:hypothetical protein [Nocardioides sambongensis]|uniref:hypothetical protein n=1 Tax=Nocardioides sambongensis TaxID=2589074 RepID=UPI00112894DC|nr:hypothetical protein [Nocardioides sambongensis]
MILTLRMLASSMIGAVVLICFALWFVVGTGDDPFAVPETWALAVVVAEGAAAYLLVTVVGYNAPAVPPGAARESWVARFQASMMVRLALGESTALIALALAFIVPDGGYLLLLVGAAMSLVTMGVHGYPWDYPVERYRARLERDGGTSYLREDLGLPPKPSGAIREL